MDRVARVLRRKWNLLKCVMPVEFVIGNFWNSCSSWVALGTGTLAPTAVTGVRSMTQEWPLLNLNSLLSTRATFSLLYSSSFYSSSPFHPTVSLSMRKYLYQNMCLSVYKLLRSSSSKRRGYSWIPKIQNFQSSVMFFFDLLLIQDCLIVDVLDD